MFGIFGAILPRFALLAGWYNDPTYWNAVFGSQLFLLLGFIALPDDADPPGVPERPGLRQHHLLDNGRAGRPRHMGHRHLRGAQADLEFVPRDITRDRPAGRRVIRRRALPPAVPSADACR